MWKWMTLPCRWSLRPGGVSVTVVEIDGRRRLLTVKQRRAQLAAQEAEDL